MSGSLNGGPSGVSSTAAGKGANGATGATGATGAAGVLFDANGFRLTLTSGVPVTTTDVTAAGTLYLTPLYSGQIALYTAGAWAALSSAEVSLALVVTSGKNYDVFAFNNAGAVALELSAAWTTNTARADALAQQDGVWVKSADHSRRYLGTLRASGTNTTEDSASNRLLYNFRNQQPRPLLVIDGTTSWAYTSNAWRQARASAANQWTYVCGMPYELLRASVAVCASGAGGTGIESVGVGIDSTTVNSATLYGSGDQNQGGLPTLAAYQGSPGIGFHTVAWLEAGGTSVQFYGNVNAVSRQNAGMSGEVPA